MPLYEYRCRSCDTVFDARRSMSEASDPISCPDGHPETVRLLSVVAMTGKAGPAPAMAAAPRSGGGCGGHCACH